MKKLLSSLIEGQKTLTAIVLLKIKRLCVNDWLLKKNKRVYMSVNMNIP
jgi:hypothetical protein